MHERLDGPQSLDDGRGAPRARLRARWAGARGVTVVEILAVLAVLGLLAGMAVLTTRRAVEEARYESSVASVAGILSDAREKAISERRDFEVQFDAEESEVILRRLEPVASGTSPRTEIQRVKLENQMEFQLFDGVPDTPFAFGRTAPVTFPVVDELPTIRFTPEGSTSDASGDFVNGTVFMGIDDHPESARAVTVQGTTSNLVRWSWNKTQWIR